MKRFIKIFTSFLLVCCLILTCKAVHITAAGNIVENPGKFFAEEDILNAWGTLTKAEQADYAGVYVDGDAIVLLFKEGTETLKNAIALNKQNGKILVDESKQLRQSISIKSATYSYDDLMTVYNLLVDKAYSLGGVSSISLSNKENCIDIGISAESRASEIQKKLLTMIENDTEVKNIENESILHFHAVAPEDEFSYTASINGNSKLKTTYSNGTVYYSAAVKHFSNTYGEGFITTGHGPSVGDAVKCGSTTIGYVKEVHHDGTDDTAFVKFSGSHNWQSITTSYEELILVTPAEGTTIKLRGYLTTPYAEAQVTSNTYSYYNTQDGITWTDLIQTNYGVSAGDSGGAAYWGVMDAGRTTRVIGVITAGNGSQTLVIKSTNIERY